MDLELPALFFRLFHFLSPANCPGSVLETKRGACQEEAHVFTRAVAPGSVFPVDKLLPDSFGVYELECLSEKLMYERGAQAGI
jgi:hypothetical protein